MLGSQSSLTIHHLFRFSCINNEAKRLRIRHIVPHPIQEDNTFVANAQDTTQVNKQPHHPCKESRHLHFAKFCHCAISSHSSHSTKVLIAERFEFLAFFQCLEIARKEFTLLDGHLCQLWVSTFPIRITLGHNALVTNGKHIVQTFHLVVRIDHDAATSSHEFGIKISHFFSSHTTHPDERARSDLCTILQNHAMILIVRHHLVQEHIDTHRAQKTLYVRRSGRTHSRKKTWPSFDEINVHQTRRHIGIVLREDKIFHF